MPQRATRGANAIGRWCWHRGQIIQHHGLVASSAAKVAIGIDGLFVAMLGTVPRSTIAGQAIAHAGAALDSTAGLIKLVAMLHFTGDDEGLVKVMGRSLAKKPGTKPQDDPVLKLKTSIDNGGEVGRPTILAIMCNRAKLAAAATGQTDDDKDERGAKNINAVREAMATLKDGGEHDRIIAEQAAEVGSVTPTHRSSLHPLTCEG